MTGKQQQPKDQPPAQEPADAHRSSRQVDIVALTAAVERLLRRDLAIRQEQLRGNKRR